MFRDRRCSAIAMRQVISERPQPGGSHSGGIRTAGRRGDHSSGRRSAGHRARPQAWALALLKSMKSLDEPFPDIEDLPPARERVF
jgi:hypothetical protein